MNGERRRGLQNVRAVEPEAKYWRTGGGKNSDEVTVNALNYDGFLCIEQSLDSGRYRLIGSLEAADKWPELFHFFQEVPEIVSPNPDSKDVIARDFYTMEYSAGYYSQPGIRPSEGQMMSALHGLFSEYNG